MKLVWLSALMALLLDQASKYGVIHGLGVGALSPPYDVLPPLLRFIYGENHGINFGLFGDGVNRWVWVGLALVICGWLIWWLRRVEMTRLGLICAGLVIGGALGNVIDRVIYGYVLDFLNMSCCGINNPFVFNVADIFIFVGAIGLVFLAPDDKKPA